MMEDVKHKFMTLFASFFFFSSVVYSVKTGIKAEFKAPSATIPLKKFGIIKAIRKASYIKVVPKKLALVADLVRGMQADEAIDFLAATPKKAAKIIYKTIVSAVSNAENNDNQDRTQLYVAKIVVTKGPTLKRGVSVSRGRYHRINKRTSHLSLELSTKVN